MMTIAKMQMVRGGMKTESPCDKYVPAGAYKLCGSSGLIRDHLTQWYSSLLFGAIEIPNSPQSFCFETRVQEMLH